jgi:hypothetical protein
MGNERRKYPRVNRNFLAHYRSLVGTPEMDLTQLKNVSVGGAMLTTRNLFKKGDYLSLKIRLPGAQDCITPAGKVVESSQIAPGAPICHTRLEFVEIEEEDKRALSSVIENFLLPGKKITII